MKLRQLHEGSLRNMLERVWVPALSDTVREVMYETDIKSNLGQAQTLVRKLRRIV